MVVVVKFINCIYLGSVVIVLFSLDLVWIYEDFVIFDVLSNGWVEIMVGRGLFIEFFLLFGYDLDDY